MKKLLFLLATAVCGYTSFGQTIVGADMETWRTGTAGSGHPVTVMAPASWFGDDSLIIGLGQTFGGTFLHTADSVWVRNLFREDSIVHGGSHSAKVMTMLQDTLLIPGVLTTATTHVGITFLPPSITGVTFTGGNAVNVKPTSVSAWVQYFAGKDSTGATGIDSGVLNVQALSHIGGRDSVIGTGSVTIGPSSSWVQVTANVSYSDTVDAIDTMRISFGSSKPSTALDSSTLYVDDVTMTSVPNPDHTDIGMLPTGSICVTVMPARQSIVISDPLSISLRVAIYATDGKLAMTRQINGSETIDLSALVPAVYIYVITDEQGRLLQRGRAAFIK